MNLATLALAAHAVRHLVPAFNANFYIVAATVIPVLFLAIAVQGTAYASLLKTLDRITTRARKLPPSSQERRLTLNVGAALVVPASAILLFSAGGEIAAVIALYQQQASSNTAAVVLPSIITMIIATATGPALTFIRAAFKGSPLDTLLESLQTSHTPSHAPEPPEPDP